MTSVLERLDHFVVPVDDVLAAESFYTDVLGGRIARAANGAQRRRGLSVSQYLAGFRPHTFFDLAGKQIGVYLQCEPRPKPTAAFGAPTYSFETTPASFDELQQRIAASGVPHDGEYFTDPAGNHYHVYVGTKSDNGSLAVGYLRLEAPDLEEAIEFYGGVLGVMVRSVGRSERLGVREATLVLPSGQLLLLAELPFSPKGVESGWDARGAHLAFSVQRERWDEAIQRLDDAGVAHGDTAPEGRRRDGDRDTYFADPAGNRIQLVGMPS